MQYDRFGEAIVIENETIHGISKSEMASFISCNQERYMRIFKKNENRKFFLQINFAAMFLSVYWMFYRKMYLAGIVFLLCSAVFSTAVYSISINSVKNDVIAIREQQNQYAPGELDDIGRYINDRSKLDQMERQLKGKLFSYVFFPYLVFTLCFGLIADCLYRNHVLRRIQYSNGGVSKVALLGALALTVCYNSIMGIIQQIILNTVLA